MKNEIPQQAKKVFEWILFDTYQYEVTALNWETWIYEKIRWYDVVKAICIVDWKVLISNEIQPECKKITLPWWILHKWEDPLEGAKREVLEETGYEFSKRSLIKEFWSWKSKIVMNRYYYLAKDVINKKEVALDEWWESIEILHYSIEDFKKSVYDNRLSVNDLSQECLIQTTLLDSIL